MKKISIAIITASMILTNANAEFNLFGKKTEKEENKQKETPKPKSDNRILKVDDTEDIPEEALLTEEEIFIKRQEEEARELQRLKTQNLEDYLGSMKKEQRED